MQLHIQSAAFAHTAHWPLLTHSCNTLLPRGPIVPHSVRALQRLPLWSAGTCSHPPPHTLRRPVVSRSVRALQWLPLFGPLGTYALELVDSMQGYYTYIES